MAGVVNGEVDDLLRQAEQRLASQPSEISAKSYAFPSNELQDTISIPASNEDLHVREAQNQSSLKSDVKNSAGSNWFNVPKTNLTPEFKREWQILRMRGLLDPKHQKKALRTNAPEYSHVGEIVAGPTDFYSARIAKRDRKNTILEETIQSLDEHKLRSKYAGIQRHKSSGRRGFYQKLVSQRRRRQN